VRGLLIETYPIAPPGFNWEARRWDGYRFYNDSPELDQRWQNLVHLWETKDGKLVGAVHPEGIGSAYLELHPEFRHIEEQMIEWAQSNLASQFQNGRERILRMFSSEYDTLRCRLLEKFGFERTTSNEIQRRVRLGKQFIPESPIATRYDIRSVKPDDLDDCRRIALLLNAAFKRDFHTANEYHTFSQNAPCFHPGLDLVAVASNGSFASYVGIAYIEENRYGVFEPVCTHPDHLRKGLARSLMLEGFRRLQKLGAIDVWVGTGDQLAANRLYESVGFTEAHRKHIWRKVI
jgi:mycothiol synthase